MEIKSKIHLCSAAKEQLLDSLVALWASVRIDLFAQPL